MAGAAAEDARAGGGVEGRETGGVPARFEMLYEDVGSEVS